MFRFALIIAAACAAMTAAPVTAHEYKVGTLTIGHPWARATPKGASVGAGYFSVTNAGTTADRLLRGSTDAAQRFEVHEMTMDNGVMKMRPLPNGLQIKPGQTVKLQPGGYHVMFVGLKQPLVKGQHINATLEFEKAGKVKVYFLVEGLGAMHGGDAKPGMAMPGMKMEHGK
jgi:copper(I)-binding protein